MVLVSTTTFVLSTLEVLQVSHSSSHREDPLLLLLLYSNYGSKCGTKLVKKAKIFVSTHPSPS
jgi:hypothetical protein